MQKRLNRVSVYGNCSLLLLALTLIAGAARGADASGVQWKEKLYNPKPAKQDVLLPMPCGGAMAFCKVETEAVGALGDQEVWLGDSDFQAGYSQNLLKSYVAGSFSSDARNRRYFLLGKYEVTELQYRAAMDPECPTAGSDSRLPKNRLNWYDAVEFTQRYSLWLLSHAKDQLPREGDAVGFVRLPTDTEWEFAARGGLHVSPADFRAPQFPMNEGINKYVWYAGSDSANGKLQPIGLLNPNPLGLYDILGNVDEIVFDLFQLTKHSRPHGQAGGYVARGGNYQTSPEQIRTATRNEASFFQDMVLRRSPTTGFRVAVAGPVIVSPAKLKQIETEWAALRVEPAAESSMAATPRPAQPAPQSALISSDSLGDPLQDLLDLEGSIKDENLKKRLEIIRATLARTTERRNEFLDRAAREALRSGSIVCQKLRDDDFNLIKWTERGVKNNCDLNTSFAKERCATLKNNLVEYREIAAYNLRNYADGLVEINQTYPLDILRQQKDLLLSSLKERAVLNLMPFVELIYQHVAGLANGGARNSQYWYDSCTSIAVR